MRIAVCDDLRQDREKLRDSLKDALAQRRVAGDVMLFVSGDALLERLSRESFDAYFLDIYMEGLSGVETAYRLRERDPEAVLVFTTTSSGHMAEGFDVGAVHYLVKPVTPETVGPALDRCLKRMKKQERYISLTVDRAERNVLLSAIRYAESHERQCLITTASGVLTPYIRIGELEAMLDGRFLRCHRSFVINMDEAEGLFPDGFLMTDGATIPVKRDRRAALKQRFEAYCFEKMRERSQ